MARTWINLSILSILFLGQINPGPVMLKTCSAQELPASSAEKEVAGGKQLSSAIFAAGCFWCVEKAFDHVPGVLETISGYTGGRTNNPTYDKVKLGRTGHFEAVKVVYDPSKISYQELLDVFWRNIDPFDPRGQFCDRGNQYRAAIFTDGDQQQQAAEASLEKLSELTRLKIMTEIKPVTEFYPAEEYHQNYYLKNPAAYQVYSSQCGRDQRLMQVWGQEAGGYSVLQQGKANK